MLDDTTYHRQLEILPPDKAKTEITIIGAGGIGSHTAFCLAKIGCENIIIYDDDKIEAHNLPSQFYSPDQVNQLKVNALSDTILKFTAISPVVKAKLWQDDKQTTPVIISAVDSMATRKEIYKELTTRYDVALYIDARMSAEQMRLYAITPSDPDSQKFYSKTLYNDDQAIQEHCSAKAICYNTFIIGGLIASIVKKFFMSEPISKEIIFNLRNYQFYTC